MISQDILNFVNRLADISSPIAHKYFRVPNGEIAKEDDSPVTKADREIEVAIREEIMKNFPTHGIIGEEYGNYQEDADFKWVIDPIDGTSSFIIGRPLFGTLIALTFKGRVILGLMNQPIIGERWIGIEGGESTLNGRKIQTRKCKKLSDAVLGACSPFFFQGDDSKIFEKVSSQAKYQNFGGVVYGGDCYLYAMIATGCLDLIIDPGLKVYDYAALIPIVESAGGVVTDWEGKKLDKLESGIKIIAAATSELHIEVLSLIRDF